MMLFFQLQTSLHSDSFGCLIVLFVLVCLFFNVCVNRGSFLGFNLNVVSFSLADHE